MIIAIIPARYNSSRLPGKMLLKINDKSIIERTYEQTKKCSKIDRIIIATDETKIINEVSKFNAESILITDECINGTERIAKAYKKIINEVSKFNAESILITDECINGTERIAKAYKKINNSYKYILNVQGDEPFINPEHINFLIDQHQDSVCSTLHYKIKNKNDLHNKGVVKIIINKNNEVIYGSRAMIPSSKDGESKDNINYYAHIGIFLFDSKFIYDFLEHPNTPAQLSEDLEWLKIIEMGYKINSYEVEAPEIQNPGCGSVIYCPAVLRSKANHWHLCGQYGS